jgi:uncharacterized protein (DUF1501 family)
MTNQYSPAEIRINRRHAIRVGGLSVLGLGLSDYFSLQRLQASANQAKAKSCILIWLEGGPSHLEMFDPKPDAPIEVRGPMESIATSITGIRINECMQQTSQLMEDLAIIRSVTSPLGEHNFGTHYLMTGYKPTPALEYPYIGSVIAQTSQQDTVLPPNIAIPRFTNNISGNGFLPSAAQPFSIGGNPQRQDFKVRDLDFYNGLNIPRIDRRRKIVAAFDQFTAQRDLSSDANDSDLERAFNLLSSEQAKAAFNLSEESAETRNRYGMGDPVGQSCLLARRLIQRGVPFVTVNNAGWDTHANIDNLKKRYATDRNAKLPSFDRALAALITDLKQSGMLSETLVVVMGEFGRTPKVNPNGGRDHWPRVFSIAMAGGGIRGGQIYGTSNPLGEFPKDHPVTPADITSTIFTLLGIDPSYELHTIDGRPVRVAPDHANVIRPLIG